MDVNGYRIQGEFTTENAGLSRWAFGEKDGREFFIKEFLTPVFPEPTADLSPRILERKRKVCLDFYRRKNRFYQALERCRTGNNVIVREFFLEGTHYYAVTEKIDSIGRDPSLVEELEDQKKLTVIRAVLYSVAALHRENLVHADMKPDNILLKATGDGFLTAKIIDFDAGFFSGEEPDEVQGDFLYLAPETFLKMRGEAGGLTGAIDIFALGLLFHQYWTGELPHFDGDSQYAFEAVLNGEELRLDGRLPESLRGVLRGMLEADPLRRITAQQALIKLGSGSRLKISRK